MSCLAITLHALTASGEYQDAAGREHCEVCPKDTYASATGSATCSSCQNNTETHEKASTSAALCVCKVGVEGEAC